MAIDGPTLNQLKNLLGASTVSHLVSQVDVSHSDNEKLYFGTADDSSVYYDGTNFVINPQEVGSGSVRVGSGSVVVDTFSIVNSDEGATGKMTIQTAREVITLTSDTETSIAIPSGAVLLGASFCVNTAVTDDGGDDTWSAAYKTGSTTALASGAAATKNTKVDTLIVPEVASDATEIEFTPNGGSFTAGVIEIVTYYYALTSLASS